MLRQIEYLSKHFSLGVIGYNVSDSFVNGPIETVSILPPDKLKLWRKFKAIILLVIGRTISGWAYDRLYWSKREHKIALDALYRKPGRAIHANDWTALPVAVKASERTGAYVVLDLHEYYAPLDSGNRWYWRIFYGSMIDHFLQKCGQRVWATVTVNETIADRYSSEYGFRPFVVMNAAKVDKERESKLTDPEDIRLVHHGAAIRDRRLEMMIETVGRTDARFSLHFMLIDSGRSRRAYVKELKNLADRVAPGKVFFHTTVGYAEIIDRLSMFDMGIFLLPPTHFSYGAALPNKFFDFVAAGLAVCVGPSPEMAHLAKEFDFGIVTQSFEPSDVARSLNDLSGRDIDQMKLKSVEARKVLNATVEMDKLIGLYHKLLAKD